MKGSKVLICLKQNCQPAATDDRDMAANGLLGNHWGIVTQWTEKSRYQMKTQAEAEELYHTIADSANGVMQWIKARW